MQSHECPQGVVKQPYGNTAYMECELCTAEGFAHGCGGVVRVLSSCAEHCGAVCSQVLWHWPCVWSSCVRRCRDPGVVSTKSEENETELLNICLHLFWGHDGKGSRLDSGSPMAWLVMAPVF